MQHVSCNTPNHVCVEHTSSALHAEYNYTQTVAVCGRHICF